MGLQKRMALIIAIIIYFKKNLIAIAKASSIMLNRNILKNILDLHI